MVMSRQLREILKVISKLSNKDTNAEVMNTMIYNRLPNFPENEIDYKLNELASRGFITTSTLNSTSISPSTSPLSRRSDKLCHITREGLDVIDLFSQTEQL
jgi:repressor of nif and glnA expression